MDEQLEKHGSRAARIVGAVMMVVTGILAAPVAATLAMLDDYDLGKTLVFGILLAFSVQMAGGFSLAMGELRGRQIILGGSVALVGPLAYLSLVGFQHAGLFWIALAPTLVVVPLLMWKRILRPASEKSFSRPAVVMLVVFGLALSMLAAARNEIRTALWDLRYQRWAEICEGDPNAIEACGRSAIQRLREPSSIDDLRAAMGTLDRLCTDENVGNACWIAAYARSGEEQEAVFGADLIARERNRIAKERCEAGDMGGCFVLTEFDSFPKAAQKPIDAACRAGDTSACVALLHADGSTEVQSAACKAGVISRCEPRPPVCLDGEWFVCGEDPETVALTTLKAQLQHNRDETPNPALYGVTVEVDDVAARCDAGSAAACFVMGLNATADINPYDHGPPPIRSLDISMGRACELGANIACYVFALRLLDVEYAATREVGRARELLDASCGRGHQRSCDLRANELLELPADLDLAVEAARGACLRETRSEHCRTWAHLVAFQLGAEPWLRAESLALHRMIDGCARGQKSRCMNAAGQLDQHTGALFDLMQVRRESLAREACGAGRTSSCRQLFRYAEAGQHIGMKSPKELRGAICPQLPEACED